MGNTLLDRLNSLMTRLSGYFNTEWEWLEIVIELALIWAVVSVGFRFLRGTRGARVIKGVALLLIITTLGIKVLATENAFERINFLYENFLGYASLALVIVFQPELRRALVRLGEARLFRSSGLRKARVIEEVISSVSYLSQNKIGALIVIERDVGLDGIVEAGTPVDAVISHELLNTIFWPGSALHDLAVVVRGDRLLAAGVQLPLAEAEQFSSELGSRHRAAYGLSLEADPLIIVVSEETGTISIAERGSLVRNLSVDGLRSHLVRGLGQVSLAESDEKRVTDTGSEAA